MLLTELLRRHMLRPTARSTLMLLAWSHLVANGALAADESNPNQQRVPNKRPQARIGVSAVVLPKCVVRIESRTISQSGQPLEVRCTKNTDYQLNVGSDNTGKVGIQIVESTTSQETRTNGNSSSQPTLYEVSRNDDDIKAGKPDTGIAILSLDF